MTNIPFFPPQHRFLWRDLPHCPPRGSISVGGPTGPGDLQPATPGAPRLSLRSRAAGGARVRRERRRAGGGAAGGDGGTGNRGGWGEEPNCFGNLSWRCFYSPTAKLAMGSLAQNSSGAIRCSCNTRFRRRFRRVPEGSGADGWWGSGGFRCRWLMRFRRVPGQIADEVPAGSGDSGANSRQGCGGFRGRKLMRSRGFWCRWLMRFQEVPGQMARILPRSSKLLGITHEFIILRNWGKMKTPKHWVLRQFPKVDNDVFLWEKHLVSFELDGFRQDLSHDRHLRLRQPLEPGDTALVHGGRHGVVGWQALAMRGPARGRRWKRG